MEEWNLYEDNQDLLTEKLIEAVKSGDKSAEWRLILIFKSEIIRACSKLAMRLNTEFGIPNNGPEPHWMVIMEEELAKGYRTSFRLDYWDGTTFHMKFDEVNGGNGNDERK